jgi:hypothetical protein
MVNKHKVTMMCKGEVVPVTSTCKWGVEMAATTVCEDEVSPKLGAAKLYGPHTRIDHYSGSYSVYIVVMCASTVHAGRVCPRMGCMCMFTTKESM